MYRVTPDDAVNRARPVVDRLIPGLEHFDAALRCNRSQDGRTGEDEADRLHDGRRRQVVEIDDGADQAEQQRHQDPAPQEADVLFRHPDVLQRLVGLQPIYNAVKRQTKDTIFGLCSLDGPDTRRERSGYLAISRIAKCLPMQHNFQHG